MAQKLIQTQEQKLAQNMRLSQQQLLQIHLLEMPLTELEENINAELDDNPALEKADNDALSLDEEQHEDDNEPTDFEAQTEKEERQDALDAALENIDSDDVMPTPNYANNHDNADYEEMVYGDTLSFYDRLKEQMGMLTLSDEEHAVMEYLIGSLDDDGLLRKDLGMLSDELAIYHNIDVTPEQIEAVLKKLQSMDPAGIGARSLQECLLLQVARWREEGESTPRVLDLLEVIFAQYFDAFTKNNWDKIKTQLHLTDVQVEALQHEIRKLNPKPGAALGETEGRSLQQITPDFIVDTADDGTVTFSLNNGQLPELRVSSSFKEMADAYKQNKEGMSRQTKEALLYAKEKVARAQGYIAAIKQRQRTMMLTMGAIIEWQKRFFQEGDETELRPMILKDIADRTGLDISTVSRVSNVKYAQTRWGTFPLRFFFTDTFTSSTGEAFSTRQMRLAFKAIVDNENKQHPLSDDALAKAMAAKGFPIARRTAAKYREQLNIPTAKLRKET